MGPDVYAVNPAAKEGDEKEGETERESPYKEGMFMVSMDFASTYPTTPPKIKFETPVYHPNIKSDGQVCSDFLSSGWKPSFNVRHVIECIRTLLAQPNGADPLNPEIGRQYNEDLEAFEKAAKEHTERFAMD